MAFLQKNPRAIPLELAACRRSEIHWFRWWAWTYNPNLVNPDGSAALAHLPFDLFKRQEELVAFVLARVAAREDGLIEKSREIGFTYLMGGLALHHWLFVPGFKTAFGSRTKDLVDTVGNPDTIFEKIRIMRDALPHWMLPTGYTPGLHDNYCRLINPETGDSIVGEGGDEIGRGGRNSLLVIDEAAYLPQGDRADRSTSANSQCRIFGSTVNGMGDMFARKRHGGTLRPNQIFRFHFSDDPRKDAVWEMAERARLEPHVFAAEYDIDYSASVEGICIPARWVESAKRLKHVLPLHGLVLEPAIRGIGGLDVGAGKARSVFVPRFGPIVMPPTAWREPDTTETAFRALDTAQATKATRADGRPCTVSVLRYDEVGVGKGVLSTLTRHGRTGLVTVPINTGVPPSDTRWPDGMTSAEKFGNLKAEIWWLAREKFKSTFEMVLFLEGKDGGQKHALSDLISLPDDSAGPDCQALATQLSLVKWNRNEKGKIVIETKVALAKRGISSPDHAEGFMLTYAPDSTRENWLGAFGG